MSSPLVYERNHWIARDWELGDDLNIRREAIASHPGCWFRVREAFTEASNKCSAPNIIDGISDCQGNKHSFTSLNSCFGFGFLGLIPPHSWHFPKRVFRSLFFPLLFFLLILFSFLASRLKRQLHITIVVAVLRDRQNSPPAAGLRFVLIQSVQT